MALKSTIFKLNLSVADMNRQYYEDHSLTIARHPSETDLRMLVRIIVFALNAHEHLQFTKGLADAEEPDLWQMDLTGQIQHWIDLGQPVEKRIRQSCSKAAKVSIYTYQKGASDMWYETVRDKVERFKHLKIFHLAILDESAVERIADRTMNLNCTIEDDRVLLTTDTESLTVECNPVKP